MALISGGLNALPRISTQASPLGEATTRNGLTEIAFFDSGESWRRPISRFTAKTVASGLVIACRLAICPPSRSPDSVNATIDGVVRLPSELGITTGSPPSITATQELVVPRSIPMTLPMDRLPRRLRLLGRLLFARDRLGDHH